MANLYPSISFSAFNLVHSDSISFDVEGTTRTFECSHFAGNTPFFYSPSTPSYGSESLKACFAASLSPLDYTVSVLGSVVTIQAVQNDSSFDFGAINIINSAGSLVSIMKQVDALDQNVINNFSTDNIDVISIVHQMPDLYPAIQKEYNFGNIGDFVRTTITFETPSTLTYIDYKWGFMPNDQAVYDTNADFQINEDLFISNMLDTENKLSGGLGALTPRSPKGFFSGDATFTSLGGNQYEIVHNYYLPPVGRESENTGTSLSIPDILKGGETIKFICEIEGRDDITNLTPVVTTRTTDLTNILVNGNVGHLDEFLKSGPANYTLDTFSLDTTDGVIDAAVDSIATAVIDNEVGSFTATTDLIIFIQEIKGEDEFQDPLTLEQNLSIERLQIKADGIVVSGTNIVDASATFIGAQITMNFTIPAGSYNSNYAIWVAVSNDTVTINHNNVTLQVAEASSLADENTVQFAVFTGATRADYNFNYHYEDAIIDSFNQVKSFIEDRMVARWKVIDSNPSINELVSFKIEIKSLSGGVLEERTFYPTDISFSGDRGFKLASTDLKDSVVVNNVGSGEWEFTYGFQIWQSWTDFTDIVLSCSCSFNQTIITGDIIDFTKEFRSPAFELATYDITKNTIAEPQVLRSTFSQQFFDSILGIEVKGIIKNRDTRVVGTFQDDNLNDMGVTLPELTGYQGVNSQNDNQFSYEGFHSTVTNSTDRPFDQVPASASFNAYIKLLSVKSASIESIIKWDALNALFPNIEKFYVSSRLDKLQVSVDVFSFQTNVLPPSSFDPQITGGSSCEYEFEDSSTISTCSISTISNGLDGTVQTVMFTVDDFIDVNFIDAHSDNIYGGVDLSLFTSITSIILWGNLDMTNITYPLKSPSDPSVLVNVGGSGLTGVSDLSPLQNLSFIGFGNSTGTTEIILPMSTTPALVFIYNTGLIGVVDLSNIQVQSTLSAYDIPNMTGIILAPSIHEIGSISIYDNPLLTGVLDLEGQTGIKSSLKVYDNPNMTGIILPPSTLGTGDFSIFWMHNNGLVGAVDLTGITRLGGEFRIYSNSDLTSISFPTSSVNFTSFSMYNNPLLSGSVDLNTLTSLGGAFRCYDTAITELIFPTSLNVFTFFDSNNANLTGTLNVNTIIIKNDFIVYGNALLTGINHGLTTELIDNYRAYDCDLTGLLDLSLLSNLGGQILIYNNTNLTGATLPASAEAWTEFDAKDCGITGVIDFTVLTGTTVDFAVRLDGNAITNVVDINLMFTDLDGMLSSGSGQQINFTGGTNAAPTGAGLAAAGSLSVKGFSVTHN